MGLQLLKKQSAISHSAVSSKRKRRGMLALRASSCIIVALDLNDRSKAEGRIYDPGG